ncbi:MAG: nucleotide exchange factor GrpE [Gemmatimonadaceae bacterium]
MRKSRESMNDSKITDEIVEEAEDLGPAAGEMVQEAEEQADGAESDPVMDRVSELEHELTMTRDKHLRLVAEFDNFRKRMIKEKVEAEARGQGELVRHLMDPLDDIARFAHLDPGVTDSKTIVEGVAMVERKLEKSMRSAGLEPVNPTDEAFDPASHEAVATEPTDSRELDGTIARVYQVGYTFKGQLLRPARVVVRQYQGSR